MGIIADMKGYRKLLKKIIKNLKSYSKRYQSRIDRQSPVSCYHTTKEAQILTVKSTETDAESLEKLRKLIKDEINSYEARVNRIYVRNLPLLTRAHYQSKRLEKLFEQEYSDLSKARKGKSGQGTSSNTDAHLSSGEGNVSRAPTNISQAEKTYRENLTGIYQRSREFEEERLNDIRNVLVSFVKAIHSVPHIGELNQFYKELIAKIEETQKTQDDLDFWAQTHGIPLVKKPVSTAENPSNSITTAGNEPTTI